MLKGALFALALVVGLGAQAPTTVPAERLTETEALRLQVLTLQQQLMALRVSLETCHIEADHPGYRFDPQQGLVKK